MNEFDDHNLCHLKKKKKTETVYSLVMLSTKLFSIKIDE